MFVVNLGVSQQIPLKSLYLYNRLSYNPAETGTREYVPIYLSGRKQWVGVKNAPETQNISLHTPMGGKLGLGLQFYNETTGITSRTGGAMSFSYRTKTSRNGNLAFGISAMFTQFNIDRDKIVTQNPNDLTLINNNLNYFIPDVGFGLNYFGDKFRIGFSSLNLIETKKDLSSISVDNTLDRVFYLDGDLKVELANKWRLIPSLLTRYMLQAPIVFEGNIRIMYNKLLWIGAGYRYKDAMIIELGLEFKNIVVGYAYDHTTSEIRTISSGTHEVLFGYQIKVDTSPQTSSWKRRNRIYTNERK